MMPHPTNIKSLRTSLLLFSMLAKTNVGVYVIKSASLFFTLLVLQHKISHHLFISKNLTTGQIYLCHTKYNGNPSNS